MQKIVYTTIGRIETPFTNAEGMPIQAKFSQKEGYVIVPSKYRDGLKGIEGFSHLILIYHFHKSKEMNLQVKPFLSTKTLGIFTVRAPNRPNPIGISVVELVNIEYNKKEIRIKVKGVDMLDQTPLLDIKPYIDEFDSYQGTRNGWYNEREFEKNISDDRFVKKP
ncbi:MAG: tRNA (N6-threonylcarbamoyladenosine(37)-N6)-methyltransferase TrmO [Candidatus Thorarchaeota archaeon]